MEVRFNPALTVPYSPEQVYTQAAVADLVEYAWKRGIRCVGETVAGYLIAGADRVAAPE